MRANYDLAVTFSSRGSTDVVALTGGNHLTLPAADAVIQQFVLAPLVQ